MNAIRHSIRIVDAIRHFLHDFMRAHTGMSAAAEELLPHIQNALDRAFKYKDGSFNDYKIVITGHSLGEFPQYR